MTKPRANSTGPVHTSRVAGHGRVMTADLAVAADPQVMERSADPAAFVVQACERAKAWLTEALEHGEIEQIAEVKSQAEAVRVYTTQKQLGLGLDLSDLLDLAVLQRLPQPGLRPLAGLHHKPRRVGGTLDHIRGGGQRQLSGHHRVLPVVVAELNRIVGPVLSAALGKTSSTPGRA